MLEAEDFGIEALSRGANEVWFCDNSYTAVKFIKENLKNTNLEENSNIINKDFVQALKYLAKENKKFDIIFLDPPYKTDFGAKAMEQIIELNLLSDNGIIVFETDDKNKKEEILRRKDIEIFSERKYGNVLLIFVRKG